MASSSFGYEPMIGRFVLRTNTKVGVLKFTVGQLAETKTFQTGFHAALFKCKLTIQNLGVALDITSYNILLKSCFLAARVNLAQEIYSEIEYMKSTGSLKLDVFTYSTMIKSVELTSEAMAFLKGVLIDSSSLQTQ
ncbi:hypothetical protein LXL04_034310 [Taraxacum kok-saghyz]